MTTAEELNVNDVYSHNQITRLASLQGVAGLAKGLFSVINTGILIELADYVIGDDVPFDPVVLAHEAREALNGTHYNGYDEDCDIEGFGYDEPFDPVVAGLRVEGGCMADWDRADLDSAYVHDALGSYYLPSPEYYRTKLEEFFTVSDLAGFLTLPKTAILEDEDGDTWHHDGYGWTYAGDAYAYKPSEMFDNFGPAGTMFHLVVTNPEVLS